MPRISSKFAMCSLAAAVTAAAVCVPASGAQGPAGISKPGNSAVRTGLKPAKLRLLWKDEFNGKRGLPPSVKTSTRKANRSYNWVTEITGNPYNHERQFYTDDVVEFSPKGHIAHYAIELNGKGSLAINARRPQKKTALHRGTFPQDFCAYGACEWVSGRMNTKGQLSFKYGQIMARVWVPEGGGTWPALWLLGSDIDSNSWPSCGEIDVLETAPTPNFYGDIVGTLHSWPSDGFGMTARYTPDKPDLYSGWHTVGIRWLPNRVDFIADGSVYQTVTKADMTSDNNAVYVSSLGETYNREWPFNKEFFMILNLAMGGHFGGDPDDSYRAPDDSKGGSFMVDWIRVYSVDGVGKVFRH